MPRKTLDGPAGRRNTDIDLAEIQRRWQIISDRMRDPAAWNETRLHLWQLAQTASPLRAMLREPAHLYVRPSEHLAIAKACLRRPALLSGWEKQFLISIQNMIKPTDKQLEVLFQITAKLDLDGA